MSTPIVVLVIYVLYFVLWHSYELRRRLTSLSQMALLVNSIVVLLPAIALDLIDAGVFGAAAPLYSDLVLRVLVWFCCVSLFLFRLGVIYSGLIIARRDAVSPGPVARRQLGAQLHAIRRQVWLTVAGGLLVTFILGVLGAWCIATGQSLAYLPSTFRDGRAAGFHAVTGIGGILVLWTAGWMVRGSYGRWRISRASAQLRLLIGACSASVGFTAMGLAAVIRAVPPLLALGGITAPAPQSAVFSTLQLLSGPFVAVGLTFPLVVARLVAWRNARFRTRVASLWEPLTTLFRNSLAIDSAAMTKQEALAWEARRRQQETIDGLRNFTSGSPSRHVDSPLAAQIQAAIRIYDAAHPGRSVSALLNGTARPLGQPSSPGRPRGGTWFAAVVAVAESWAGHLATAAQSSSTVQLICQTFAGVDAATALERKILVALADTMRQTAQHEAIAAPVN